MVVQIVWPKSRAQYSDDIRHAQCAIIIAMRPSLCLVACLLLLTSFSAAPKESTSPQAIILREAGGRAVSGLSLSRDGNQIAVTPTNSRAAEIIDIATRKVIKTVPGGMTTELAIFSPDGKNIATSAIDFWVHVNKIEDGSKISSFVLAVGGPNEMQWSRDGKFLAIAQSNLAALVDPTSGQKLASNTHEIGNGALSLALAPDENAMAIGGSDRSVIIYSTREFEAPQYAHDKTPRLKSIVKLGPHSGAVNALAYSPDGSTLVAGDASGSVTLWDLKTQQKIASWIAGESPVVDLAFAPSGQSVAVATRSAENGVAVQLWDVAKNKIKMEWQGAPVTAMHWMPGGKTLLVGNREGGVLLVPVEAFAWHKEKAAVKTDWNAPFATLPGDILNADVLAWSRDGSTLAAGTTDAQLALWDLQSGERVRPTHGHKQNISHLQFSPDGKTLASSGRSGIEMNEAATGKSLWRREGHVALAGFSPDGATIYVAGLEGKQEIFALSSADGKTLKKVGDLKVLGGFYGSPQRAALSPTGDKIAVSIFDGDHKRSKGVLGVWDIASQKLLWQARLEGYNRALLFSPDGSTLIADDGDRDNAYPDGLKFVPGKMGVKLFNAQSGAVLPQTKLDLPEEVMALAYSPDGKTLAVSFNRGAAELWDENARPRDWSWPGETFPQNGAGVRAWAYSPDGAHLAAAGSSGPVRFWKLR